MLTENGTVHIEHAFDDDDDSSNNNNNNNYNYNNNDNTAFSMSIMFFCTQYTLVVCYSVR